MEFNSIVMEGTDQVGKADTSHDLSQELLSQGVPICTFSFPQYATPFGGAIRLFLKDGVDEIEELKNIKDSRREIEVRMMMYALDRLQALESILRAPNTNNAILLLDRGPYSNALTIAYGLSAVKNISDMDVKEMVNLGFEKEQYLIQTLNLDKCIIQLVANFGKEGWKSIRDGGEDQYEKMEVQERANEVYLEFSNLVRDGWRRVITKEDGKWEHRGDRNGEILSFVEERYDLSKIRSSATPKLQSIDVLDIAKDMYGLEISQRKDVKDFYRALKENEKEAIYEKGLGIGEFVALECKEIHIKDSGVRNAMYNIINDYPECLVLLERYYTKSFVQKLIKAIDE
jgi:thymidylate kinase